MLQPKKQKFRKSFDRMPKKRTFASDSLHFGEYGLMSLQNALIHARQIDSARKVIVGYTKRKGKLWIRIFPDRSITKKPAEVKMGKGKGDIDHYSAAVKTGKIIFEIGGVSDEIAREALTRAGFKLAIKVKIVDN